MKADRSLPATNFDPLLASKRCSACNSVVQYNDKLCHFCGADLSVRVCPYCMKSIPFDEDPCHFCGHLEPAELPDRHVAESGSSHKSDIFWLVIILAVALAMIIWPAANQPDVSACEPDHEISCFLETYWGVSGGVLLITLSMLSVVLSAITKHLTHRG